MMPCIGHPMKSNRKNQAGNLITQVIKIVWIIILLPTVLSAIHGRDDIHFGSSRHQKPSKIDGNVPGDAWDAL